MTTVHKNEANDSSVAGRCSRMAAEYDSSKDAQDWRGPEVIFGLVYAFVRAGESLLDIGIGTGLSSVLFHKAGLRVHGMDVSPQMLEVCAKKNFAEDLKVHDMTVEPYPYPTASFDHAVCIGVLNHFDDLAPVFRETSRVLRDNGTFAVVVGDRREGESPGFEVPHAGSTVTMFRHSAEQIRALLQETGFAPLRELEFAATGHEDRAQPLRLRAYVARRQERDEREHCDDGPTEGTGA